MRKYTLVRTKGASLLEDRLTVEAESYGMACKIFGVYHLAPGILWRIDVHEMPSDVTK